MKKIYYKAVYTLYYLVILLVRRWRNDEINNSEISKKFVFWNNKRVMRKALEKDVKKEEVAILLPHCIQKYICPYKITSDIDNCKECGMCKIGEIKKIKKKYGLNVKVATGGTLARMFLKETKPKIVIAVACERDLVSGIYDSLPILCYGVFNRKINGPCIDTDVLVEEIEEVIKKLR